MSVAGIVISMIVGGIIFTALYNICPPMLVEKTETYAVRLGAYSIFALVVVLLVAFLNHLSGNGYVF